MRGDAKSVMRPPHRPLVPTTVAKSVRLPKHRLSSRLGKVLAAVDVIHSPKNLKAIPVLMDGRVLGGLFVVHADTGPYEIYLDPDGHHPELSLLHEVGHYLEWQSIPKDQHGMRDFSTDGLFTLWLQTILETPTIQRLLVLLEQQQEGTQAFQDIAYLLRLNELWTRAYSQYVARKANLSVVFQQMAAENKVVTGNIRYGPYWGWEEFASVQDVIDAMFDELGWSK